MKTIHKYALEPKGVLMPMGAQILTVGVQNGTPFVWAVVYDTNPRRRRNLVAVPTGGEIDSIEIGRDTYIGTAHGVEGGLVFHFFDLGEEKL